MEMKVNFMGSVAATKLVAPDMAKRGSGDIVLVASALGSLGLGGYTAYSPTKWALRGFADCLRMEMQAHGVRVFISYPPYIDTPGHGTATLPSGLEKIHKVNCLCRGLQHGSFWGVVSCCIRTWFAHDLIRLMIS